MPGREIYEIDREVGIYADNSLSASPQSNTVKGYKAITQMREEKKEEQLTMDN